jgi:hypothetical protein
MAVTPNLRRIDLRISGADYFAERTLRNISPRSRWSLRLDAGGLDHLAPFLGFLGDELAKIGGRARRNSAAQVTCG